MLTVPRLRNRDLNTIIHLFKMLWWLLVIFKSHTFYHGLPGFKWCVPCMLAEPYYANLFPILPVPQAGQTCSYRYWRGREPETSITQIFTGFKVTCCLLSKAFPDLPTSNTIIFPFFPCTFFPTIIFYFIFAFITLLFFSGLRIAYVLIISSWEQGIFSPFIYKATVSPL